jgi:hypothetical protein
MSEGNQSKPAIPAWQLRKSLMENSKQKSKSGIDAKQALKKKMDEATLDPNLPPAFKLANKGRLAFAKQQNRRKNNDTFMSMNSSHPAQKESEAAAPDSDSDDSSFASMGEGEIIEEEEEE